MAGVVSEAANHTRNSSHSPQRTHFIAMDVSVVIPTINEEAFIQGTINAVCRDYDKTQVEVIVVDGGGSLRRALLGDMLAAQAAENGWAGLVINGAIRDVDEIGFLSSLELACIGPLLFNTRV